MGRSVVMHFLAGFHRVRKVLIEWLLIGVWSKELIFQLPYFMRSGMKACVEYVFEYVRAICGKLGEFDEQTSFFRSASGKCLTKILFALETHNGMEIEKQNILRQIRPSFYLLRRPEINARSIWWRRV